MKIQLTKKQLQILTEIQSAKQVLQVEATKLAQREQDAFILIVEGAGVDSTAVVGYKAEIQDDGVLVIHIPEAPVPNE